MLNRRALCCTWSCGSCERPCRVSSPDTAVPDTLNTASSFPFSLKWRGGGAVAFPAAPAHLSPSLSPCCFHVLIQLPLRDHSPDTWLAHTLDWRDVRKCSFMACGVCYSQRSPGSLHSKSHTFPILLSFHLKSTSSNPLHTPQSTLFFVPPVNLFNTPLLFPSKPAPSLHLIPPLLSILPCISFILCSSIPLITTSLSPVIYLKWPKTTSSPLRPSPVFCSYLLFWWSRSVRDMLLHHVSVFLDSQAVRCLQEFTGRHRNTFALMHVHVHVHGRACAWMHSFTNAHLNENGKYNIYRHPDELAGGFGLSINRITFRSSCDALKLVLTLYAAEQHKSG